MDCVLRFWLLHDRFTEAKKPWPENSTFAYWWQTIEDRVLLCVEDVARHLKPLLVPSDSFMVHRDVPPVTSSQQFIDELATHLRIATGFTTPFDLKEHFFAQLLASWHPLGAGRCGRRSGTGSLCHGAGASRRACGRRQPVPDGWCAER